MGTLILKSFQHLYKLLKVYLTIGLFGALAVVAWGVLTSYPNLGSLISIIGTTLLLVVFLINRILMFRRRPPAIADFILYALLPDKYSKFVIGDFHESYYSYLKFDDSELQKQSAIIGRTKLRLDMWYWKEVLSCIPPLIELQLEKEKVTGEVKELKERLKQILPFYRDYGNRITTGNPFHDLFP